MDLTGVTICDELPHPETHDIVLPNQTGYVSQIAIDIGGSLAKVVYFARRPESSKGGRLNFKKFENEKIDECIDFVANLVAVRRQHLGNGHDKIVIKTTGGGAYKYSENLKSKLDGASIEKEDEMDCLITGLNFLISEIPYEVFTYSEDNPMCFEDMPTSLNMFPYMLVNIGSGVSILKVTGPDKYERISGSSLGGGTLWGLLSLLTGAKSFDEMLESSKKGDYRNVDMLVGDIYGSDYSKVGLKATTIASSMGKVFKKNVRQSVREFRAEDISQSVLFMVSNNIGQVAYLNAQAHGLDHIYFGGCFIRGYPTTMNRLSYAINFWSQGNMKALFLRHEGYLGAVGAFLKHKTKQRSYSFSEIFTTPQTITSTSIYAYGILESTATKLMPFPLLHNPTEYHPDTVILTDPASQHDWINTLESNLHNIVELAIEPRSDPEDVSQQDVQSRASTFETLFRGHLKRLRDHPNLYGALTIRNLLNLREQCLRELGFRDVFAHVKAEETRAALRDLPVVLSRIDAVDTPGSKIAMLIDNLLAGNMFDWGSSHTIELRRNGELSFESVHCRINRVERFDQTSLFVRRLTSSQLPSFRNAVLFVDNSGADIILGVIPFARFLLSLGTRVILAANSAPAVNDVTVEELNEFIPEIAKIDKTINLAWSEGRLSVMGTGSAGPCLDLGRVNDDLTEACRDVDFVFLEGMGRAIHTNYHARFSCASLKVAVFKNQLLAKKLGANIFDALVLYSEGEQRDKLDSEGV